MKTSLFLFLFLVACGAAPADNTSPNAASQAMAVDAQSPPKADVAGKIWSYNIVNEFDHGEDLFTQGLFIADGALYESTGKKGHSQIIRHGILSKQPLQRQPLPEGVFGEGATAFGDKIISLTWRSGIGYVHQLKDLSLISTFPIRGEGWGLTSDGKRLIMSDGSNRLRFLDPDNFQEIGWLSVTVQGRPVTYLNELEWVEGEIWANVWKQDVIVRIDPDTGVVTSMIDMRGLYRQSQDPDDVLNGIAYDPSTKRLFVTGKRWPKIYEIKLIDPEG